MKKTHVAALLFGLGVVWFTGCGVAANSASKPRKAAPDVTLQLLDGGSLQLSSLKGKVVLVDFWATWCPPCVEEVPHLQELYTEYQSKGVEIVGISLDQEGAKIVKPFVQQHGVTYTIAVNGDPAADAFGGIRGLPTAFLLDKEGKIAKQHLGYQPKETFEREIQALLAE